ncbi:PREDICTED: predicted GPI-anchored protein 58 [Camelina sativa]|uniref:Predicted GPI-anchored protein 58 n=1 Tax=Camelina sativa TaxID=90675 RepID=A0ABM0XHS2_CAMSA|nr:PREDICTED: predicted GPI-anchored protein 58 [Camelina sativa]XP_010486190.1 PREDICTED: predicted GPI-anchored protein 58 [Camelina sativa]
MESNKTFLRIIVIVTVSTLATIFITPVESKYVGSRSLLHVFPPSSESESPSPAPAPGPEVMNPITSPAYSPADETDIEDYPAASPEAPTPAEADIDSPAASPQSPTPTESDIIDSPAASPEAPTPAESDIDSPAASPEDSNPPSEEDDLETSSSPSPSALSGIDVLSSAKNILNTPLLSPEIKTICGKTDFPPLCESSVSPLLPAQLKPDVSSVLVLAIQASVNATRAAMAIVEKLAADDCKELYDDALANLEDATNAVKSRDFATVNTNLSAAMTDYSTCNDGFEEAGEPNPLADVGGKLTKMVSNCLAISTLIK